MTEIKKFKQCKHKFVYSHTESPVGTFSAVPPDVDVVVCENCGAIKRTNKT